MSPKPSTTRKPISRHPAQIENTIGYALALMGIRPNITLADAVKQVLAAMKEEL